jgi:hypothetical protein
VGVLGGALFTAALTLYVARPQVVPKQVIIECAICDDPSKIFPPKSSEDNAAVIKVLLENTGAMGTTILNANTTIFANQTPITSSTDLIETPAVKHFDSVDLGSHSAIFVGHPVNEAIINIMRHPPAGMYDNTYFFGHVTCRSAFWIPQTQKFCFHYVPPLRGRSEQWELCPL